MCDNRLPLTLIDEGEFLFVNCDTGEECWGNDQKKLRKWAKEWFGEGFDVEVYANKGGRLVRLEVWAH